MVFSSVTFLYLFLPLCILFYFLCKNIKWKNIVLLIFSLLFYAWGEPVYLLLMISTSLVDYLGGLLIDKYRGKVFSKVVLALTAGITLSSLGLFKYFDFFAGNVNSLFSANVPLLKLALPIGISFYTFRALTYVVDVYRGPVGVQKSFYKLLLYVTMFPQLIAGPIVRYSDVEAEINNRHMTFKGTSAGVLRFSVGLLKKVLVANIAGELTDKFIGGDLSNLTALGAWAGILAYALQIYFDFSGYSDMAIGLGSIFGFRFPENFNYPYTARSINDFWRRWHMTLSSFFRDYLYIPLGGNRKNWAFNMLVVWLLTGFWHGASWNYMLWGLYYFVFLMLEKLYFKRVLDKIPAVFGRVYSIFVILIGWAFFYFEDLSRLKAFFASAFGQNGAGGLTDKTILLNYAVFLVIAVLACLPIAKLVKKGVVRMSRSTAGGIFADLLSILFVLASLFFSTAALMGSSYNPFLYFRF